MGLSPSAKSPISLPTGRLLGVKTNLIHPPSLAEAGAYWCKSAHIEGESIARTREGGRNPRTPDPPVLAVRHA